LNSLGTKGRTSSRCPQDDGGLPLICYWLQAYHFEEEIAVSSTVYFVQNVTFMAEWGKPLNIIAEKRTFEGVGFA